MKEPVVNMLERLLKYLIWAVLALTPVHAVAQSTGAGSGLGHITEFWVSSDGSYLRIQFDQSMVNPSGCSGTGYYIYNLPAGDAGNRMLSAVMTAAISRSSVSMWISGCSASLWNQTWPLATDIYVETH